MLNQVILVGRLTADPEFAKTDTASKVLHVVVAVPRAFKNTEGLYESDFIKCTLWNSLASNTVEYCKKGDLVGIKGRIQTGSYEKEEGNRIYTTEVIAERISFLSHSNITEEAA